MAELLRFRQAFYCEDAKLRAALANLRRRLVLGRVVPPADRVYAGELQNGHATGCRAVAFEQRIALTARQISSAVFGQDFTSQLGIFLLNRFVARGRNPLDK